MLFIVLLNEQLSIVLLNQQMDIARANCFTGWECERMGAMWIAFATQLITFLILDNDVCNETINEKVFMDQKSHGHCCKCLLSYMHHNYSGDYESNVW